MRVFESKVRRGKFRRKTDGVTGRWRKLYSEEFHSFYSSSDVACFCKMSNAYRILVRNPYGESTWDTLGIEIDLEVVGLPRVDCIMRFRVGTVGDVLWTW